MELGRIAEDDDARLPEPSAELVLLSSITWAMMRQMSRTRRKAFLQDVSDDLAWQSKMSNVLRIRPKSQDALVAERRAQALSWWRIVVGIAMTRLER